MEQNTEAAIRNRYHVLTRELIRRNIHVTTMESCTSGQIASLFTDTEGASAILKGAFITYSNEAKVMAGVRARTIQQYGVYSEETAKEMAMVCRKAFDADVGIGVTGTMGNVDPANPQGIPGEVFYALAARSGVWVRRREILPQPSRLLYKLAVADLVAEEMEALLETM